jgi:hypothetical protein
MLRNKEVFVPMRWRRHNATARFSLSCREGLRGENGCDRTNSLVRIGTPNVFRVKLRLWRTEGLTITRMMAKFEYQLGRCDASIKFAQTMSGGASIQPLFWTNTSAFFGSEPSGPWISGVDCRRYAADRRLDSWVCFFLPLSIRQ